MNLAISSIRHRNGAPRAELVTALWPDCANELAGQSLNTLVFAVHRQLGDAVGGAAPILHSAGYYRLNAEAGVGVDVASYDYLARIGEHLTRSGNLAAAAAYYRRAVALYRGDLCGSADVRAIVERERLRALHLTLLARLAEYHYAEGDYDACLRGALTLLTNDPCREDAHRMVMRCYVRRGERAQALRQYQVCATHLRAEFDATPEAATTALFDQVRRDPGSV